MKNRPKLTPLETIRAILALRMGVWDAPELEKWGSLHTTEAATIDEMVNACLENLAGNRVQEAAPDLLAALEGMLPDYERLAFPECDPEESLKRDTIFNHARAAIARAKGEAKP